MLVGGAAFGGAVTDEDDVWTCFGSMFLGGSGCEVTGCASSSFGLMSASSELSEMSAMMIFGSRSEEPKCGVDGALGAELVGGALGGADRES